MDIGTPERYLQASWDILEGRVETRVRPTAPGLLVAAGAEVASEATAGAAGGGRLRLHGRAPGRRCASSVLLEGCTVGAGASVRARSSLPASRSRPGLYWPARWSAADERVAAGAGADGS